MRTGRIDIWFSVDYPPFQASLLNIQRHCVGIASIRSHHHGNRRARKSGWNGAVDLIEPRVPRNPSRVAEVACLSTNRDGWLKARVIESLVLVVAPRPVR